MEQGTKEIDDYLNKWWNELSTETKRNIWRSVPVDMLKS